jgi:hypothetical protein
MRERVLAGEDGHSTGDDPRMNDDGVKKPAANSHHDKRTLQNAKS